MRKIRILLENPAKDGNIGSVIRNIYSFDSGQLIIPSRIDTKKCVGASCGTLKHVTIRKVDDTLEFLKKVGWTEKFRRVGFVVSQEKDFEDAVSIANKFQREKYSTEIPIKKIVVLQNIDFGQIWNITFISKTFNTLNMKIDAGSGQVKKHLLVSLFSMGK